MLTEWLLSFVATVLGWIADLFGVWQVPPELLAATDGARSLLAQFASVGVWVNWPVLNGCIIATLTAMSAVVGVKIFRAIVAHFPGFGGSGD